MSYLDLRGEALIRQHEGERQIALALAHAARAAARRLRHRFLAALSRLPGDHQAR